MTMQILGFAISPMWLMCLEPYVRPSDNDDREIYYTYKNTNYPRRRKSAYCVICVLIPYSLNKLKTFLASGLIKITFIIFRATIKEL